MVVSSTVFNRHHSLLFVRFIWVLLSPYLSSGHQTNHTQNQHLDHSEPHWHCYSHTVPIVFVLRSVEAGSPCFVLLEKKQMFKKLLIF